MDKKLNPFCIDLSPFEMEVITKIPMSMLAYSICDFYWDKGHKSIRIIEDPKNLDTYTEYKPDVEFENIKKIKKISVATHKKKENKQKFDSVIIHFEKSNVDNTKILWKTSFGFKMLDFIYIGVSFLIGLYVAGKPHTTGLSAFFVFVLLLIPFYLILSLRVKKIENDPNIEKYKKEFEEYIREKEEENFSD